MFPAHSVQLFSSIYLIHSITLFEGYQYFITVFLSTLNNCVKYYNGGHICLNKAMVAINHKYSFEAMGNLTAGQS